MKKIIFITILLASGLFSILIFQRNQEQRVEKAIENAQKKERISYKISSIDFEKTRPVKDHFTYLNDVLYYNKDLIVTRGGILQGEKINRFFNGSEFSFVNASKHQVIIGYRKGFLLVENGYINRFEFDEQLQTCSFAKNRLETIDDPALFCIKGNQVLKKEDKEFILLHQLKEKILDFAYLDDVAYILTPQKLHVIGRSNKQSFSVQGKKFFLSEKGVFVLSDREVFQYSNLSLKPFKKVVAVSDMFMHHKKMYYATLNGVILDENLKKVHQFSSLINRVVKMDDVVYFLTPKGIFVWNQDIKLLNIPQFKHSLEENYITQIYPYQKGHLIAYFNAGVDRLTQAGKLERFIEGIHGVNDIYLKEDTLFIATTDGLIRYQNGEKKVYGKKEGILGRSVSQIIDYNNTLFLGTEAGVSKRVGDIFLSMNGLHGLINNRVNAMHLVKNKIYVGTLGGVSLLKGLDFLENLHHKHFKTKWITDILSIKDDVYMATYGGGIYRETENRHVEEITTKKRGTYKGRIFINLHTLLNYKDEYLLAGTLKKGILVYAIKKKEFYFIDELPSLNITALTQTKDQLFVGSDFGFWTLDMKQVVE